MDVLQIIRPKIKPLKASYDKLSQWHKLTILLIITSLVSLTLPHQTLAQEKTGSKNGLVFVTGNHDDFMKQISLEARQKFAEEQLRQELERKNRLIEKLEQYLNSHRSPLAEVVPTLINLKNWKKIVALSAAESSYCRKYPIGTANCWGVGGAEIWDFGSNLHEGVISMNKFLETHPKRSKVKYSQMSFEQMNGLYKQPAAEHWLINNQVVYNDLVNLEREL
ncbi:MAG: hypothetical protein HYV13_02165 [Candidatus Doudnabacteria bacterium]|nr:hypothetical protein [Candidatus Doudnabacteria bacterium]